MQPLPGDLVTVACDLCGSQRHTPVMKKRGALYDHEFTIVACADCGLVFVNPRLDDASIEKLYDTDYYKGLGFDRTVCYEREAARPFDETQANWAFAVDTLDDALGGLSGKSILDIGCGTGGLVRSLVARGADAVGMDSSAAAMKACGENGTPLADATIEGYIEAGRTFDAVTMAEVIEHTLSPRGFLQTMVRLVKPGGILYLTTGNWNLVRHASGTPYVMPEGHIYYFTPVTMRRYFTLVGMDESPALNRSWIGWRIFHSLGVPFTTSVAALTTRVAPEYAAFPIGRAK